MNGGSDNRLKLWVHITAEERDGVLTRLLPAVGPDDHAACIEIGGLKLAARVDEVRLARPVPELRDVFAARLEVLATIEDERL